MGADLFSLYCVRGRFGGEHFSVCGGVQKSYHANGDKLFYSESRGCRLFGNFVLFAAKRGLGRDQHVVLWCGHVQSGAILTGEFYG